MEGWIKLHRKIIDSEIFASQTGLKIWVWILCRANHKITYVPIKTGRGETIVSLHRGELLFGRETAEKCLQISGSTIYRWVKKLEQKKMISLKTDSHYTVITVCNYDFYNENENMDEQATNRQRTGNEQAMDTYKNDKNVKEENISQKFEQIFESFKTSLKGYPGLRGSYPQTFDIFKRVCKKHHLDPAVEVEKLLPAIRQYTAFVEANRLRNRYPQDYKNLKTWINNLCWQDEYAAPAEETVKFG